MANKRKQILTPEADKQLLVAFTTCKDGEMRTRIQAVRLYGNEVPVNEITYLTGLPRRTILRWCGRYLQQGLGDSLTTAKEVIINILPMSRYRI